MLGSIIVGLCDLYVGIILIYVLMSWIPNMHGWVYDVYAALGRICDPYLDLFRRIIPPIGMVDISPIFAILVLQFAGRILALVF